MNGCLDELHNTGHPGTIATVPCTDLKFSVAGAKDASAKASTLASLRGVHLERSSLSEVDALVRRVEKVRQQSPRLFTDPWGDDASFG